MPGWAGAGWRELQPSCSPKAPSPASPSCASLQGDGAPVGPISSGRPPGPLETSLLILALGRSSHQFHLPTPPLRTTISSCGPADVDECEDPQSSCLGGECKNTAGSYQCLCPPGFQLANGTVCEGEWLRSPRPGTGWGGGFPYTVCSPGNIAPVPGETPPALLPADVDECVGEEYCAPRGECLNSHGSFFCLCADGFVSADGGTSCQGEKPAAGAVRGHPAY